MAEIRHCDLLTKSPHLGEWLFPEWGIQPLTSGGLLPPPGRPQFFSGVMSVHVTSPSSFLPFQCWDPCCPAALSNQLLVQVRNPQ